MQISFNTSYTNSINFGKRTRAYALGYTHGKQDGFIGKDVYIQEKKALNDKEEYGEGYNKGYKDGKRRREEKSITRTDMLQYFVVKGMARNDAKALVEKCMAKPKKIF